MSSLDHSFQFASFRSKKNTLFTKFSQQASKIIRQGENIYHRCIDNADVSLTLGDLVRCNYNAILSGWDLHEKLWRRVDTNFSQMNKKLRRKYRSISSSIDASITDLWKQTQDLRKEFNAQKKLIDRQADLITGLEQRLTRPESSNSQGAKHRKPENIISSRRQKERIDEIELAEVELNPVVLGLQSYAPKDVSFTDNILFQANPDL